MLVLALALIITIVGSPAATATGEGAGIAAQKHCVPPATGEAPQRATPGQVGLDPDLVARAMAVAAAYGQRSVRVHRNNCLVAVSGSDPVNERMPWHVYSATKSVVSMLAGIAWAQGRLDLAAPIGRYLPAGLGDRAHRAITVTDLLTQTSGLRTAPVNELIGSDPDIVRQAMALPIDHPPGTRFEYSQRGPDLLAAVVAAAVGEDLQAFAQRELFTRIGIEANTWFWLRDRSGNTFGATGLFLTAEDFARLGTVLVNNGTWRGQPVIPARYVRRATASTSTNACYGYLFWINRQPCIGASLPSRYAFDSAQFPGLPADTYAMRGAFHQDNVVVPSLRMLISWTGASTDPSILATGGLSSRLDHEFFRLISQAVQDATLIDPGPYTAPDHDREIEPGAFIDPDITLGAAGAGDAAMPGCTALFCAGSTPTTGAQQNAEGVLALVSMQVGGHDSSGPGPSVSWLVVRNRPAG